MEQAQRGLRGRAQACRVGRREVVLRRAVSGRARAARPLTPLSRLASLARVRPRPNCAACSQSTLCVRRALSTSGASRAALACSVCRSFWKAAVLA